MRVLDVLVRLDDGVVNRRRIRTRDLVPVDADNRAGGGFGFLELETGGAGESDVADFAVGIDRLDTAGFDCGARIVELLVECGQQRVIPDDLGLQPDATNLALALPPLDIGSGKLHGLNVRRYMYQELLNRCAADVIRDRGTAVHDAFTQGYEMKHLRVDGSQGSFDSHTERPGAGFEPEGLLGTGYPHGR